MQPLSYFCLDSQNEAENGKILFPSNCPSNFQNALPFLAIKERGYLPSLVSFLLSYPKFSSLAEIQ